MKRLVSVLSIAGFVLLAGCEKGCAAAQRLTKVDDAPTSAQTEDIKKRTAKLSGDIMQAAFEAPDVKAQQDAVWAKVFQEPDTAKALQDLVSATMADPAVTSQVQSMMAEVMKDPLVIARIKEIAKGASTQSEIQERIEKHVSGAMESPAVNHALDHGVEAFVAAPDVEARLHSIFSGADMSSLVGTAMEDPELVSASKDIDKRVSRAASEGKLDGYYDAWRTAANKDPAVLSAARDFSLAAIAGIATSPDVKEVMRGGFSSDRTRKILVSATTDLLADKDVNRATQDFFREVFAGGSDQDALAQKTDALFKNPVLAKRLESAILELLSSKIGAAKLESAILNGMSTPDSKKKLTAFVLALMKAAPAG